MSDIQLTEEDIEGASLKGRLPNQLTVRELKFGCRVGQSVPLSWKPKLNWFHPRLRWIFSDDVLQNGVAARGSTNRGQKAMASERVNGPFVGMYSLKPYYNSSDPVELPDCMYKLANIHHRTDEMKVNWCQVTHFVPLVLAVRSRKLSVSVVYTAVHTTWLCLLTPVSHRLWNVTSR